MKSKGLGDTIEKITKITGVKKLVDYVNESVGNEKGCGCSKRKNKLNKLVPYKKA
jgi:hypothetical protein